MQFAGGLCISTLLPNGYGTLATNIYQTPAAAAAAAAAYI